MLQETLKEFFPSWGHIRIQEEVIAFTCGLMNDPTPLVNHVYEAYVELASKLFSFSDVPRNLETALRVKAQGKNFDDTSLLNELYTESRVSLFGHPQYNQFVCINANYKGEIDTPSKLYSFCNLSKHDVPKFTKQDGSEKSPECVLWIQKPDAASTKSLLSTCCEISKRQPVTHFMIDGVKCEDLTPAEAPALSRNVQTVVFDNCYLPTSFWKRILHQLFDCVNLQSLWFRYTNIHLLEETLDELLKNLESNTGLTNHQVEVVLRGNTFSGKFVKKWNGSGSGIMCKFEPVGHLILRDYSISDGVAFEALLLLSANKFLTVLDLSGTKLGHEAIHISYILALGNLKQLHLPHCEIPTMALDHILSVLHSCKELTHLNLCGNNLEACGHHVTEVIMA